MFKKTSKVWNKREACISALCGIFIRRRFLTGKCLQLGKVSPELGMVFSELRTRNGFPDLGMVSRLGEVSQLRLSLLSGKRFLTGKWLPPWRGFPIDKCFITQKVFQLGKVSLLGKLSRSRYSLLMVNLRQRARS